ncbi:MAG: lysophospholipid acyltransferase family protein [Alcanivorax jadensis]|uniref:lysophospholipid acyltransferase family protein n=1 Tax=Alcanivorax jadensis TaxID=64988 RepID=UPI0030026D86
MAATTLLFGALCLLLVPFLPADRVARLTAVPWARLCLFYSNVRVDVHGSEHLKPGQSYVIVANHLSQFDIFVLYGYLGVDFRWVMKHELRRMPVIGICCEKLGHIFINRSDTQAAMPLPASTRPAPVWPAAPACCSSRRAPAAVPGSSSRSRKAPSRWPRSCNCRCFPSP